MRTLCTLTSAESKRFLGRGITRLDSFRRALDSARVIVANGTTNAYIIEELTGEEMDRERYTAGVITHGRLCATDGGDRMEPMVFSGGRCVDEDWEEVLDDFGRDDLLIKGANAVDPEGNVGVLAGSPVGGTIGRALHIIQSRGSGLLCPVGLEKLVPSVHAAAEVLGIETLNSPMGMAVGMIPVTTARVFTEVKLIRELFGISATHVASGGTGGSEGAVTIAVEGKESGVRRLLDFVRGVKGEEPIPALKRGCRGCDNACTYSG